MATGELEIERKYEAEASLPLPDLGGLDGVATVADPEEQELEATYYDSADLRLLRSRVTLRRRTGGTDAGWHVKLPASATTRRELRSPLGRAVKSVPKAVTAPVLGVLGTAAAVPVATVATRRTVRRLLDADGRVLAEVADDSVTGTALPAVPGEPPTVTSWRELEVELVDGTPELLDLVGDRLEDAGARPSSSASKVGQVLAGRLAALDGARQPGSGPAGPVRGTEGTDRSGAGGGKGGGKGGKKKRKDAGAPGDDAGRVVLAAVARQLAALRTADIAVRTEQPEGVHDLRVACRRLRSIFAAFRTVLDRERTDPLRAELRWVGAELSGARDGEVALEHLRELVAAQPEDLVLGPVATRLERTEQREHEQAGRSAVSALSGRRYLRLLDALDALVADPPLAEQAADPGPAVLGTALRRTGKRLRRAVSAAEEAEGEAREHALHDVRKAAKRVRYTAEVAADVVGTPARELVSLMKQVQEELGAAQDTVVTRAYCLRLGREAREDGEDAWTYGRLHGLEEARAARSEAAFWALEARIKPALRRAAAG